MDGRLADKVAIITGGASGIGAEAVRLFHNEGAKVVIADIREAAAEALARDIGKGAVAVRHDVRQRESWDDAVQACSAEFGPPSVLVNNAGVMVVGPIEHATVEQFHTAFAVNTIGAFLGLQAVVPCMRENGAGAVVNMASAAGVVGTFGLAAYSASKAATIALTRTAAIELGPLGIRVNAIAPGGVDTPMSNQPEFAGMDKDAWYGGQPIPRIGRAEEVARLQLFLASDESSYCTGSVYPVDGGQLAGPKAF